MSKMDGAFILFSKGTWGSMANKSLSSIWFEMSNYFGSTPVVLLDGSILVILRRLLNFRYPRPQYSAVSLRYQECLKLHR